MPCTFAKAVISRWPMVCYEALGETASAKAAYQRFLQLAAAEEDPGADLKIMMQDARKRMRACS